VTISIWSRPQLPSCVCEINGTSQRIAARAAATSSLRSYFETWCAPVAILIRPRLDAGLADALGDLLLVDRGDVVERQVLEGVGQALLLSKYAPWCR